MGIFFESHVETKLSAASSQHSSQALWEHLQAATEAERAAFLQLRTWAVSQAARKRFLEAESVKADRDRSGSGGMNADLLGCYSRMAKDSLQGIDDSKEDNVHTLNNAVQVARSTRDEALSKWSLASRAPQEGTPLNTDALGHLIATLANTGGDLNVVSGVCRCFRSGCIWWRQRWARECGAVVEHNVAMMTDPALWNAHPIRNPLREPRRRASWGECRETRSKYWAVVDKQGCAVAVSTRAEEEEQYFGEAIVLSNGATIAKPHEDALEDLSASRGQGHSIFMAGWDCDRLQEEVQAATVTMVPFTVLESHGDQIDGAVMTLDSAGPQAFPMQLTLKAIQWRMALRKDGQGLMERPLRLRWAWNLVSQCVQRWVMKMFRARVMASAYRLNLAWASVG